MRRKFSFALALLAVAVLPADVGATPTRHIAADAPRDRAVARWISFELDEIAAHAVNPPRAARALALLSAAMEGAVVRARDNPSREAAIDGAATTVLAYLFPDHARGLSATAGRASARSGGFALGRRIGRQVLARTHADGSDSVWDGSVPSGSDFWVPTPPGFVARPLEPLVGTWRPWNVVSGAELRPAPPPLPGSSQFEAELREVYDVSLNLTAEQKRIAAYWADGPGTVTPPGHWNLIALELVAANGLSDTEAAEVFAALNTAQADAFICAWDAKYAYWSPRPVTFIRRELDPSWLPYIVTPPFPAYVSGHATTSGAASTVIARFFPRDAARLFTVADEAALSRLYGGIHFRTDNDAGLLLGSHVGNAALAAMDSGFTWLDELR
jgi:hypothetical protein